MKDRPMKKLRPLLKWPGGKEKELKHILPLLPKFENYYEPFVGGGSVYTAINAENIFINDKSTDLISFYNCVSEHNDEFYFWLESISIAWKNTYSYAQKKGTLYKRYLDFRENNIDEKELILLLTEYITSETNQKQIIQNIGDSFIWHKEKLFNILFKAIKDKMCRMKKIEIERGILSNEDVQKNIETALMSGLYTYFRFLFNDRKLAKEINPLHTAFFIFLRFYAYSGMFRYNAKGEFNVPYGGMSYNKKTLERELHYYNSKALEQHFKSTHISCLDFEDFFNKFAPTERDFIFLDPPYDSEFSTYDKNIFTQADQERLANYLINKCKAKWLLDIKATPLIKSLYENKGLSITSFDKKYQVSFMNRNDKDVQHLIIKNY